MNRILSLAIVSALSALGLLTASTSAFAITDLESNAAIPFSFSNPGARSLGMGGAFVGLADDATAAYTNPAGLTQLVQSEISVEGRRVETNSPYTFGGTAALPYDLSGVGVGNSKNTSYSPSFISFVLPRGDWSFAFYRHEVVKFDTHFNNAGGTLLPDTDPLQQVTPFDAAANLHIVNYSFAVAVKANEHLSIGLGASYYDFDFSALRNQHPQPNTYNNIADNGSDHALSGTLGLRWRFDNQWSAGFAYRVGPKFGYTESGVLYQANTAGGYDTTSGAIKAQFKVPDVISAGLSYHPSDALLVNFDVDRVFYSQLTGKLNTIFDVPNSTLDKLNVPNGTEYHLGAEYTFIDMSNPLSVRAGVWHDPRHTIQLGGTPSNASDLVESVVFGGGYGAKTHVSLGLGIAFKQFELDAAGDYSDKVKTLSVSGVYRF
jgi:long-subunit fatty acid transport protein